MRPNTIQLEHITYSVRHHLSDAQREKGVPGRRSGRRRDRVAIREGSQMALQQTPRERFVSAYQATSLLTHAVGLLAGLFEPPTTPTSSGSGPGDRLQIGLTFLTTQLDSLKCDDERVLSKRHVASVPHIFSHISMTYHVVHVVISDPSATSPPGPAQSTGIWLDSEGVEHANIGTGVKKVWTTIYGQWGSFEVISSSVSKKAVKRKSKESVPIGKVVRTIMMPSMPQSATAVEQV